MRAEAIKAGRWRRRTRTRTCARTRGSALIGVFWLMAVLSLAVFTTAQLVHNDVGIVVAQKQSFRAGQLAEMGLAIAMNPVVDEYDPLLAQEFEGAEGFEAHLRSEGGRLNINTILQRQDRDLLDDLFTYWGLEEEQTSALIDSLIDWVDEDDLTGLDGAEYEYYYELGFENYPFNRLFYDIEEMALVRGIEVLSEFKPDWRDYFTLWSSGKLNVNEASAAMLEAVVQVTPDAAAQFIEVRNGEDFLPDTEDDVEFKTLEEAAAVLGIPDADQLSLGRLSVNDGTMRIESTGIVGDYLKTIVLIVRNRDSQPQILSREERLYR